MSGLFSRIRKYFEKPVNDGSWEQFGNDVRNFIEEHRRNIEEVARQRRMLETMAHHLGGLVWIKRWDAEQNTYIYEFANRMHCELFLGFTGDCQYDCTAHVRGRSDIDLLNDFRERSGNEHTYGDLCLSTDIHATEQAVFHHETGGEQGALSCRYIECGYVGDRELVLEVVKTPLFNPEFPCKCWDSHTFTVGNAIDVSNSCDSRLAFAHQCVARGQGQRLQPGVFWIYPEREECRLLEKELPRG